MKVTKRWSVVLACVATLAPWSARAGGYEIVGHSQEGTGSAYVGAITGFEDGSAAHYNPGAMSEQKSTTLSVGLHAVPIAYDFKDRGSTVVGMPNVGSDHGEKSGIAPLADVYLVHPFDDKIRGALLLTSPFGLGTSYDRDWTGRYQGVKGWVEMIKMGGALSYNISDDFSIGAGISALYTKATLENAIDFGTIGYSALGPDTAGMLGLFPQRNDGLIKMDADGWGMTWNAGALYRYGNNGKNRVGIAFRGKSALHLDGDVHYEVPAQASVRTSSGAFTDTGAHTSLTLPESVSMGINHWISDTVELTYDTVWTRWSRFDQLAITFDSPAQAPSVDRDNWHNTWRHGIAVHWVPGGDWEYRAGLNYDPSTIKGPEYRGPLIPVSDEYDMALGATYHWSKNLALHFGFFHTIFENTSSNRQGPTGDVFVGKWKGNLVQVYSAGVTYFFD